MPWNSTKFGVSEVARMFEVERDVVKTWAYHFSDYLSAEANPAKGIPRQFSAEDLRVLAYVLMYWEENPDLEHIRYGLNTDTHLERPFSDIFNEATPFFQEPPEDLDETWRHGTVIGGMTGFDTFGLAESYKLAGDMLVDAALSTTETYELIYPVIYNYRHATELYLKDAVQPKKLDHNLVWLLQEFKMQLTTEFNAALPQWFENIVLAFDDFDPGSIAFRYGGASFTKQDEVWVDLPHMKTNMARLSKVFQITRHRRWAN